MVDNPECTFPHWSIAEGMCPCCSRFLLVGKPLLERVGQVPGARRWAVEKLIALLQKEPLPDSFSDFQLAVGMYCPSLEMGLLPLLTQVFERGHPWVLTDAKASLSDWSRHLSEQEAIELDSMVDHHPDHLPIRLLLLRFYARQYTLPLTAEHPMCRHGLWLIRQRPLLATDDALSLSERWPSAVLQKAVDAWRGHCHQEQENAAIFAVAAESVADVMPALAQEFIDRALQLEPGRYESHILGGVLALARMRRETGEKKTLLAARAHQLFVTTPPKRKSGLLPVWTATASFEAGFFQETRTRAENLLELAANEQETAWIRAEQYHEGHTLLGRLALRDGNIDKATAHLVESVAVAGSPHLSTSGPNLHLADALLRLGQREAVVTFLERSLEFWESPEQLAEQWIYTIRHGGIPDWGERLRYG